MFSAAASAVAQEQDWPTRPVKVVVPNGPGGISDVLARLTSERLAKVFGKPFVIENRGGAGGVIGTEYAIRAPADGYTLYFAGGAQLLVNPFLRKLPYDPIKELTPVSMVSLNGMGMIVNQQLPVKTVGELIAYAKANPGKINYSHAGIGQTSHLAPAAFAARAGIDIVPVPYQATPPALIGVLNNTVQMFFANISDVAEFVRTNQVRMIAVSTEKRMPEFPDVPTVAEVLPGFVLTGWIGYFAPVGTPKPIVDKLAREIAAVCRDPDVVKTMANVGIDAIGNTPEEFAKIIARDVPIARSAVQAAGLMRKDL